MRHAIFSRLRQIRFLKIAICSKAQRLIFKTIYDIILYAFYANHLSSASKTRQGKQNLKVTSVLCVTSNALYMYMFHGKCVQAYLFIVLECTIPTFEI